MTYEEQLKIEKLSKETFERITKEILSEEFIEFYKTHSKQETKDFYQINNDKTLKRILDFFNYDWTFHKSLKKGKPSTRSHESYLSGGKKSSETQKQAWQNKPKDEKQAWSEKQKEAHSSENFRKTISKINKDYQANLTAEQKTELKEKKKISNKATWDENKKAILEKAYITKSKNKSFNTSKPEDNYYLYLLTKFNEEDIIRQYKDDRYNHSCDFYIKSKDLFIELNFSWTHGGHQFDINNIADKLKLESWKQKSIESDFYKKAIIVWTELDVSKFKDAKNNNLNYLAFYSEEEAYNYEF